MHWTGDGLLGFPPHQPALAWVAPKAQNAKMDAVIKNFMVIVLSIAIE
jgi:hypothetical protein